MPFFTSPVDSTPLFYRYYVPDGTAFKPRNEPVSKHTLVFLHGWPMSSKMFEHLLVPLCETYRIACVAPDRRGFGKSEWNNGPQSGPISWETFVNDTIELLKHLDVKDIIFAGASMGATEAVMAYLASTFIKERCKGFVLMGLNMPYPLQCPAAPLAPSEELWDSIIEGLRYTQADYVHASLPGVFAMQIGNEVSPETQEQFKRLVAAADGLAIEKTAMIFRRATDKELRQLAAEDQKVPMLILHGDSDQGMPLEASAAFVKELVPWAELKVYEKAGHGLYLTHARQVLDDIVGFVHRISKS